MKFKGVSIGLALTGSHCTVENVLPEINKLKKMGARIESIISPSVGETSSRFGQADQLKSQLVEITEEQIIDSILSAEPIGPKKKYDILLVAPCTGNTLAKLANGITDTAVLMAVKAQLRNLRPVVLAIATNDGLGINAKNLGLLLSTKNIFFVPFRQDDPFGKPNSLVSKMDLIIPTLSAALGKMQFQPVLCPEE